VMSGEGDENRIIERSWMTPLLVCDWKQTGSKMTDKFSSSRLLSGMVLDYGQSDTVSLLLESNLATGFFECQ
jgi:hypothetical protein